MTSTRLSTLKAALDKQVLQPPCTDENDMLQEARRVAAHRAQLAAAKKKLASQRRKQLSARDEDSAVDAPSRSAPLNARARRDDVASVKALAGAVPPARTWLKSMLDSPKLQHLVASQHFDRLDRSKTGSVGWPEVQAMREEFRAKFGLPPLPDICLRAAFTNCQSNSDAATLSKAEFATLFDLYLRSAQVRIELQDDDHVSAESLSTDVSTSSLSQASLSSKSPPPGYAGHIGWHAKPTSTATPLTSSAASLGSLTSAGSAASSSCEGSPDMADVLCDVSCAPTPRSDEPMRPIPADGKEECCGEGSEKVILGSLGSTLMMLCFLIV